MKRFLRKFLPFIPRLDNLFEIHSKIRENVHIKSFESKEDLFTHYYLTNRWGNEESVSGSGSTHKYTENIRKEIPKLIKKYNCKRILDAPCGDYNWFRLIERDKDVHYIGGDIVKPLIKYNKKHYGNENTEFIHLDIIIDKLPKCDIWILRDCLFHFSYNDIFKTIDNFLKSDIKYLLTTTHSKHKNNKNILTGSMRRLNLEKSPLNFPKSLLYIDDWVKNYPERKLGLWTRNQLSDIANTQ
jgi:SAM-dependent methyltransferase